jgi:predicted Fe-Mo cluster-binding NifX family protein
MKILISSKSNESNSGVDNRFARAEFFAIYNSESKEYEFIDNDAKNGAHGAGPKAAQVAIDLGIDVIITGNLGPRALSVIENTNIKSYRISGVTVEENVKNYLDDKLQLIGSAGPSHAGN